MLHLKTINLPPSNLCSHNHHCCVSHVSLRHCRKCATVPIKHQASKPGWKWHGKTTAVPTSTRLCNALPFNHYCVSQERNSCNNSPLIHPLNLSSLLLGQDETITVQISFSWRKLQPLPKQDSPCHCALWYGSSENSSSHRFLSQKFIKLVYGC